MKTRSIFHDRYATLEFSSTHPLFVWWSLINRSKNWSSRVCFCFADSSELSWASSEFSRERVSFMLAGVWSVHRYSSDAGLTSHCISCVGHSPLLATECLELLMMHHRDTHRIATVRFLLRVTGTHLNFPQTCPFKCIWGFTTETL